MKMLYVYNDNDYAAVHFEQNFDPEEVYKQMVRDEIDRITLKHEDIEIYVELREFGAVDPEFIQFIECTIQDYSRMEHHNFYVMER